MWLNRALLPPTHWPFAPRPHVLCAKNDRLMRKAARPCQTVLPNQPAPVSRTLGPNSCGALVIATADQHLIEHHAIENVETAFAERSASQPASSQWRSTNAATPSRPSVLKAAQIGIPRARRENSSVRFFGHRRKRLRKSHRPFMVWASATASRQIATAPS